MAIPKQSEARIVVQHHEDGRMAVLIDGKPVAGLISANVVHEVGQRAVLKLAIIGMAFRVENLPMSLSEARAARRAVEHG